MRQLLLWMAKILEMASQHVQGNTVDRAHLANQNFIVAFFCASVIENELDHQKQLFWSASIFQIFRMRSKSKPFFSGCYLLLKMFCHLCIMVVIREEKKENHDHVHSQVGEDQAPVPLHALNN